tara:strand:- start:181 stop:360 length:180 start_codon:yes stop_codon:yes gene_type:complete
MENCVICKQEIGVDPISGWDGGHNAEPIAEGRCCDACNAMEVIPARIAEMFVQKETANA